MTTLLSSYDKYRKAIQNLSWECRTLEEFSRRIKKERYFVDLRMKARQELQEIYNLVKTNFGLPDLPVYLPIRKKISVQGRTLQCNDIPSEIRIYHIRGCATKEYSSWLPRDLICHSRAEIIETLIHECAHALEAHWSGEMSHGRVFVEAYGKVEEFLIQNGFKNVIDRRLRLTGVPSRSYAAQVKGKGCGIIVIIAVFGLIILLNTIILP